MGLDMFKHMGHQLVSLNHVLDNRYFINKSLNFRIQFGVVYAVLLLLHKVSEQLLVTRPQPSLYQW